MRFFAYFIEEPRPFLVPFGHFWGNDWGIRFYSLAYFTGFYILFVALRWQAKRGWSPLRGDAISDYVVWVAMAGVILGGRLGYCLLYAPRQTFTDPTYFFTLWKGGMASHGGILGVILVMIFFSRARRIRFYSLADATALAVPTALALGRCANFLNGELWGRPTHAWWGVVFPDAPRIDGWNVPRYPSQLVEALLEGVLLQVILLAVRFSTKREGAVSLTFMAVYAVLRIVGEQFREPDEGIGFWFDSITQGQLLSGIMLLVTAGLAWRQFISQPRVIVDVRPTGTEGPAPGDRGLPDARPNETN
jgi:phosphatidylglycerol---prolipoprotein diacylglyceryl transferase